MEDITVFVHNRIEELCGERNMTLADLSRAAGKERTYISTMLNKKSTPLITTIAEISDSLGVSLSEFFATVDDYSLAFYVGTQIVEKTKPQNRAHLTKFADNITPEHLEELIKLTR